MPTVIVEEALAGLGLKLAVAPPGNPLTLKVTTAVKPPEGVMLTAYVVPAPCTTLWEAGTAERVKSGLAGPAHARMALLTFSRPPVAVRPESDGMGSTLLRRSVFRLAVLSAH